MPKRIDIPAETVFGRLAAIEEVVCTSAGKRAMLCRCECGQMTTVDVGHLRSGHTKSCGCLRGEPAVADPVGLNPGEIPLHGEKNVRSPALDCGTSAYSTTHKMMRRRHGKASGYLCEGCCGRQAAQWAIVHGRAGLEPMIDRVPLCRWCHKAYDGPSPLKGKRPSEEARAKMRAAALRRPVRGPRPPETRQKISESHRARQARIRAEASLPGLNLP